MVHDYFNENFIARLESTSDQRIINPLNVDPIIDGLHNTGGIAKIFKRANGLAISSRVKLDWSTMVHQSIIPSIIIDYQPLYTIHRETTRER